MKRSREPEDDLDSDSSAADAKPSDVSLRPVTKITELDSSAIADDEDAVMKCSLPPHREALTFRSYHEYESHYVKSHTNRCLECRKNFPTEHLLGIHIEEFHDPLVQVRREKGDHTYSCFVEGCDRKCSTHQKRRMHLIDKHMYPKNFFFGVTKDGIDGRSSLLNDGHGHRRRSSTNTQSKESRRRASLMGAAESKAGGGEKTESPEPSPAKSDKKDQSSNDTADTTMADLTGAMSALQFVPPSIRFGRARAGFAKR